MDETLQRKIDRLAAHLARAHQPTHPQKRIIQQRQAVLIALLALALTALVCAIL